MAMAEDAASVLEQFIQDVANLPAEIAHLLEEIQAKDRIVQECRNAVNAHDTNIQKFVKLNSAGQVNPKEEIYCNNIISNFDKAQKVQEEKVSLSEKAAHLLDRQIKRLDFKIRDLQNDGAIAIDPQLPSLLNTSTLNTRLPPFSTGTTGASPPLHPIPGNAGPGTARANTPITRLANSAIPLHRQPSPLSAAPPLATNSPILSSLVTNGNTTNTPQSSLLNPRLPPRSPSTDPSKRRRLNPHSFVPQTSSTLRQASLGPGTPKTQHPPAATSRGSSAGPRSASKKPSRPLHHQRIGHLNPSSGDAHAPNKKPSRRRAGKKVGTAIGNSNSGSGSNATATTAGTHLKPSPSDTGEESALSDVEGENDGSDGGDDDGEGEGDDRKYCTCRSVSYGNMVACDNDECPYEWFHWSCVGMTKEPVGTWYCEECRGKM